MGTAPEEKFWAVPWKRFQRRPPITGCARELCRGFKRYGAGSSNAGDPDPGEILASVLLWSLDLTKSF